MLTDSRTARERSALTLLPSFWTVQKINQDGAAPDERDKFLRPVKCSDRQKLPKPQAVEKNMESDEPFFSEVRGPQVTQRISHTANRKMVEQLEQTKVFFRDPLKSRVRS